MQCCKNCHKQLRLAHTEQHRCGYYKCRTCDEEVEDGHLCYMKNVDDETLIEDRTNNDPYEKDHDGNNVADDNDEQASTPKKTRKKQDKENIVQ
uniref:Uncharacterized protein n=1 Tax=Romanomermis culicivorax TaxID=13658 RepID=A0A915KU69_ROMCU